MVYVTQGNNQGDHVGTGQYAFDFGEAGNPEFQVVAARGGKVIGVRSDSTVNCSNYSCWTDANYVLIDHGDGSAGLYMHLATGTVTVTIGQIVAQGQPLAHADSTGYSIHNHLHFQVETTPGTSARSSAGWWWTQSTAIAFADASVIAAYPDGVPQASFTTVLVSSNAFSAAPIPPPPANNPPTPTPTAKVTSWTKAQLLDSDASCDDVVAGIDAAGRDHVAADCGGTIHYFVSNPDGTWSKTVFHDSSGHLERNPQIAFWGNVVYLAYTRYTPTAGCAGPTPDVGVFYRSRTLPNGTWSPPIQLGKANDTLESFRVFGSTLHATVYALGQGGGPFYENMSGSTLHRYPLVGVFGDVALRIGTDGRARIAYQSSGDIQYGTFTGSGFSMAAVAGTSEYAWAPVLALDAKNHVEMVWTHSPPPGGCGGLAPSPLDGTYLSNDVGGKWTSSRFTTHFGQTSLQLDDVSDRVYALVAGDFGLLYFTKPPTGTWTQTSLTRESTGSPVIRLDPASGALFVTYIRLSSTSASEGVYTLSKP